MDDADLGRLQRVDPTVVDDDPFWSVVRHRHRDVDLVLLPPPDGAGPAPVDSDADTDADIGIDVVRTVAVGAAEAWGALAGLIAERDQPAAPSVRWAGGSGGHALLLTRSVCGIGEVGGVDLLRDIAFRLGEHGWRLAATRREGRPLLRASNGLLDLEGEAGAGATVLRLATGVMPVAEPDRAVVRDEMLAVVAP